MALNRLSCLIGLSTLIYFGCGIPKSSPRGVVNGQATNASNHVNTNNAVPVITSQNEVATINNTPLQTPTPSPVATVTVTVTPAPTVTVTPTPTPTTSAPTSAQSFIFNDDFNLPNGLIDPQKWSKWAEFDLASHEGATASPFFALIKDVVVAGNFTISADYTSLDSSLTGAHYIKFLAICGPQVTIETTRITGVGTLVYEGRINFGAYGYRNAELQMTDPSKALANQITKAAPGGYQAKTGKLGLYVGTDHADLFINSVKKTTLHYPSRTGSCRIVLKSMDFTADNLEIVSNP